MTATLRSFVLLGWSALAVLVGGLVPLLRTGQVELRGWALATLLVLPPAAALLKARRGAGAACWASLGAIATVMSFAGLATVRPPAFVGALGFAGVALMATAAGLLLCRRPLPANAGARLGIGLAIAALALAAWREAKAPHIGPIAGARPPLAVITSLPLFWEEAVSGPAARADAPIITVLRQRFEVRPVDGPLALAGTGAPRLLLAQPRALSPVELVALDQWVRGGGQALFLADPQLHWPMALPMGDRRRPPPVTLLAGLLGHWGVRLLPGDGERDERRHFLVDGRLLTLYGASSLRATGPDCHVFDQGAVARCKVGKGNATIVADADLIDDRMWLADPARPLDTGQWTADTPQFAAQALGADLPGRRSWLWSGPVLVSAVRWAALVGIIWAMVGAMLFRAGHQRLFGARERPSDPVMTKKMR
ncbi:Gldg family protein [Sphingobium mellinum]|uniref:Gldg family protein n=1 Tax=Sphingobium mellinum TaxID=1387166 RepID=UPI0030EBD409